MGGHRHDGGPDGDEDDDDDEDEEDEDDYYVQVVPLPPLLPFSSLTLPPFPATTPPSLSTTPLTLTPSPLPCFPQEQARSFRHHGSHGGMGGAHDLHRRPHSRSHDPNTRIVSPSEVRTPPHHPLRLFAVRADAPILNYICSLSYTYVPTLTHPCPLSFLHYISICCFHVQGILLLPTDDLARSLAPARLLPVLARLIQNTKGTRAR